VYPDFGKIKMPAKSRLPTDSCTEPESERSNFGWFDTRISWLLRRLTLGREFVMDKAAEPVVLVHLTPD
jgi:hypothetical protein